MTDTQIGATLLIGLLTGLATNWVAGLAATLAAAMLIVGTERGWFVAAAPVVWRFWFWLRGMFAREHEADSGELYDLVLGHDPLTGEPDVENLADLGHMGVYGQTRYGKTTWLHSLIHQLIADHKPNELRLCISDPKTLDYTFYGRLPHLLCPIARDAAETEQMIDRLTAEMNSRAALFAPYARTAVCNSLDRYHALSGQQLPRVIAIFDELADVIRPGSVAEEKLVSLAKKCLGYGIHLICATQRPSSKVVTGEIKSQMASKFVTWMPTAREYGVVAEIPKEMYQDMPRVRGRLMTYSSKGWRFVQGKKVSDRELARQAAHWAGRERIWRDSAVLVTPEPEPVVWAEMAEDDKLTAFREWLGGRDYEPTLSEIMEQFGISKPTAIKWRRAVTEE